MKKLDVGAEYVCGFLFSEDRDLVALIKKNKPISMVGKLNGIGGRVEDGESPLDAMRREFREETGVDVEGWERFADMHDREGWRIIFFRAFSDDVCKVRTVESEEVSIALIGDGIPEGTMPNLRWLIPMALSFDRGERAERFVIHEI